MAPTPSLEAQERGPSRDGLPRRNLDLEHPSGTGCAHLVLHLHGLDREERRPVGDLVALGDGHGDHEPGEAGPNLDGAGVRLRRAFEQLATLEVHLGLRRERHLPVETLDLAPQILLEEHGARDFVGAHDVGGTGARLLGEAEHEADARSVHEAVRDRVDDDVAAERVLTESYHVATLDNDAPTIFAESADFIARVTASETAGTAGSPS